MVEEQGERSQKDEESPIQELIARFLDVFERPDQLPPRRRSSISGMK